MMPTNSFDAIKSRDSSRSYVTVVRASSPRVLKKKLAALKKERDRGYRPVTYGGRPIFVKEGGREALVYRDGMAPGAGWVPDKHL